MHLPPCHSRRDVDPAREIYFCAHPRVHIRNQLVTPPNCRICSYWLEPPPAEFRVMPKGPLLRDDPCRHLGEVIEESGAITTPSRKPSRIRKKASKQELALLKTKQIDEEAVS